MHFAPLPTNLTFTYTKHLMRAFYLTFILSFLLLFASSQTPGRQWVQSGGGNGLPSQPGADEVTDYAPFTNIDSAQTCSGSCAVTVTSDKTQLCAGDTARLCATPGFVSYLWHSGQTDSC